MGLKRPFGVEEVQEFSFKHARLLNSSNKLTELDGMFLHHVLQEGKCAAVGEDMGDLYKSERGDGIEGETWNEDANHLDKNFETNAPFSWVIPSACDEDAWSGSTCQSSLSHESPESDLWRPFSHVEDVHSCLMDRSPRKRVPIGPDHQADIPECQLGKAEASCLTDVEEEKLTGKCIILMPGSDLSGLDAFKSGEGRKECLCWNKGSMRCVRQHIMEAREDLIETIGYEGFMRLGFCEMGEEAAHKWSEEEEDLFHEVVYSNPVSLGRNFWRYLKVAFPTRTVMELVSYYFNVFILRRRAVQNRSRGMDIDSDDDEWQADYDTSYGIQSPYEDEDSAIESSLHQNTVTEYKKRFSLEDNYGNDSNSSDEEEEYDDENVDRFQGDEGNGNGDATREEDRVDDSHLGIVHTVNIEGNSCMSFNFQHNLAYSHSPPARIEEKSELEKTWRHKLDGSNDLVNHWRLPEPWEKNVDLLPTSNIIEEIFGQGGLDDIPTEK